MLTNDDFKSSNELINQDKSLDNLGSNFNELNININNMNNLMSNNSNHHHSINNHNQSNGNSTYINLMPPIPPRRSSNSANVTPTDSPLISPHRHQFIKQTKNHSYYPKIDFKLDQDDKISEQSTTFVKKQIIDHNSASNSIFNDQNSITDNFMNNFLKDNNDLSIKSAKRNGQINNSFLNNSVDNLLDNNNEMEALYQNESSNRILKSKSSLVCNLNRKDERNEQDNFSRKPQFNSNFRSILNSDKNDEDDNLLTNVKAHELLDLNFQDGHDKGENFFF